MINKKPIEISDEELNEALYSAWTSEKINQFDKKPVIITGIDTVDTNFSFPSGYYVMLGNSGSGKSWFCLWFSRMAYKFHGLQSVYFSLEMPEPAVRKRIFQQWSDLTKTELESGKSFSLALEYLKEDAIVVNTFYAEEGAKQKPEYFEAWIDKYYEIGYRIFHFDHLHELEGANDNRTNQGVVERWATTFRNICKKYPDIWMMIYAQPNGMAIKKKILTKSDISGSKAIVQKCDYFLSLNREMWESEDGVMRIDEDSRVVFLHLDKTRYTEKSYITFRLFFSLTGNFHSIAAEQQ